MIVFSISLASILYSSKPSRAEMKKDSRLLSGCSTLSPPTTAKSILSRLPYKPRALAKSFRITVVPASQWTRTFPSRIRPFAALKRTLITGIMLLLSNTEAMPLIVSATV